MPDDIAREKQRELAHQLAAAETSLAQLARTGTEQQTLIDRATALLPDCGRAYELATETLRREYNQAWFKSICLG